MLRFLYQVFLLYKKYLFFFRKDLKNKIDSLEKSQQDAEDKISNLNSDHALLRIKIKLSCFELSKEKIK